MKFVMKNWLLAPFRRGHKNTFVCIQWILFEGLKVMRTWLGLAGEDVTRSRGCSDFTIVLYWSARGISSTFRTFGDCIMLGPLYWPCDGYFVPIGSRRVSEYVCWPIRDQSNDIMSGLKLQHFQTYSYTPPIGPLCIESRYAWKHGLNHS